MPTDNEFTGILQWPGYRVYRLAIDEKNKTLALWVRCKRGNRKLECSGCGRKFEEAYDANERAVRDLPWSSLTTTVHIEVYRVKYRECGVKIEKVPLLALSIHSCPCDLKHPALWWRHPVRKRQGLCELHDAGIFAFPKHPAHGVEGPRVPT